MRPEFDLLLCCSRTTISPEQTRRIHQLIEQDIDWNQVMSLAQWHGVSPLLYWQLNRLKSPRLPSHFLKQLSDYFRYNVQRNLLLTSQLLKLIRLCHDHEIKIMPFKGPTLATKVYQNIALRQFYDLDLLILPQDFQRVKALLMSQGYQSRYQLDARQEARRLITNYECEFIHEKLHISVDLHWQFAPPCFNFLFHLENALARSEISAIAGTKIPVLKADDLLIVLCINGTKDGWSSLQRICDVAEFLQNYPDLNWSQIWQQTENYHCTRMVVLGLFLAHRLFQSSLPTSAWDKLKQDPAIAPMGQQVCDRILGETPVYLNRVQLAHFALKLQANFWQKLHYGLKLVFAINERDLAFIGLPKGLFILYYPLRCLRLVLKYVLHQKVP